MCSNVLGLCEEADLEAQMFIRIPNVQFSTEPAFLQNPCYLLPFFRSQFTLFGLSFGRKMLLLHSE
jgi:hypothetical protein